MGHTGLTMSLQATKIELQELSDRIYLHQRAMLSAPKKFRRQLRFDAIEMDTEWKLLHRQWIALSSIQENDETDFTDCFTESVWLQPLTQHNNSPSGAKSPVPSLQFDGM